MPRKKTGLSVGFLFDDTLDSDNGVAQYVKNLGAWLSSAGHEVSYLVGQTKLDSWAGGQVYSLSRNIVVSFNGNKMSIPLYSSKSKIKRVLAGKRFDVLHVMVPYSPLMSQRVINLAPPDTAVVGTFHIFPGGPGARLGTRMLRAIYGRSLKRFSAMASVSQPAADFCRQSLGISSTIIPNPLDLSAFKTASRPSSYTKRIVFLGRLVPRKGCDQLIKAFQKIAKSNPDAKLIIAGDGPQRPSLERQAAKLGVDDRVEFLGYIKEAEKPRLLASADVACFPSLYGESFGIVLVEAMAAGAKTVLGGNNPGYRSVLGQQPDCLVDPKDLEAFSRQLQELMNNAKLRQRIFRWQQQSVGQYDVGIVGVQIEAVYRSAIAHLVKNGHNSSHE